ncbi:MAG: hypothetical protein H6855_07705 [Rhodospirillales bacterium]|nr:hypothetical protein [Rhodospirillales bacterium]MCB9979709.1 hypothetical protein [Rhodospirillales bacterium]
MRFNPPFNIGDTIQTPGFLDGTSELVGIDAYKLINRQQGEQRWLSYTFERAVDGQTTEPPYRWYLIDDPALPPLYCSIIDEGDMPSLENLRPVETHCGKASLDSEGDHSLSTDQADLQIFWSEAERCYFAKEAFVPDDPTQEGYVMYFRSRPITAGMVLRLD